MEVIDKNSCATPVPEIPIGDVFTFEGRYYLCVDRCQAADLESGSLVAFDASDLVYHRPDARLILGRVDSE